MKNCLRNAILIVLALSLLIICPAMAEDAAEIAFPKAVLKAGVTLQGTLPDKEDKFVIRLTPENDNCPMPADGVNEITITGEGTGAFGEIEFDKVGVYNYTIDQLDGDYKNMKSFDDSIYNVTVYCTNVDPENVDGRLEVTVTMYRNNEGEKCDVAMFCNVYKTVVPPAPTTEPGKVTPTGVQDHWMYYLAVCAVMLVVSGVLLKVVCTKERVVKVEDGDDEQ